MKKEEIFISGLSCRFPESDSANEFFQNLLNKKNMVTEDDRRWKIKAEEFPQKFGKIKQSLAKFDNRFFGVSGKQAEKTDPQQRLLLEVSYEALVDAGISLEQIKGSRTGVYVGACGSDTQKAWLSDKEGLTGYEHPGCALSMLANRLSYSYDLKGPSETIDTACSSALVAFDRAVSDLEKGVCDAAIVAGVSTIFWSAGTHAFHRLKMLSPDGACKSFDQSANGFARAEGIAAVILTKGKQQRYRPYAKVLATGVNNGGWNSVGITFPNSELQKQLYQTVCKKADVDPKEIDYLEAHGTGTVAGDGQELDAIYEIYGSKNPNLIIGSVKSNIGHTEGLSGLAGIIKTVLCFDQEIIPPNLHLQNPNEKLRNMRVMTEALPQWKGKKAAVSSFGFGGTNAHALLEKCPPILEQTQPKNGFDLTLLAHRTQEGLRSFKALAEKGFITPNADQKQKLPYRDVLESSEDTDIANIADASNELYIVCSGNGSQWKGMGLNLYSEFPVFKATLDRCGKAVGKDLVAILKKGFSNALEATLGLVAVQLGLVELIRTFGIQQDRILGFAGHSAGEIVCSYLDGLSSIEDCMQIAHARGTVADQTGDQGLMASIGLSEKQANAFIREMGLEKEVCVACINSPHNVTLSGQKEAICKLVEKAEKKEIFNRVLDTYGKAYHSHLFVPQKELLQKSLKEAVGNLSAARTNRWFTTISNLDTDRFDANYHVEAVLRPVDFAKAIQNIPEKSIVLEIGPHSVLRSLIKENRPDLKYAALMKKDTDELETLKEGLSKLWKYGINFSLKTDSPLFASRLPLASRSKIVSWDHAQDFPVPKEEEFTRGGKEHQVVYDLSDEKNQYLQGHVIDGKILLPATSYLCTMWEVFRKNHGLLIENPGTYIFSDFEILQAVQIEPQSKCELSVSHLDNLYALYFKGERIAHVKIELSKEKQLPKIEQFDDALARYIDTHNFYRIISGIGYEYSGAFQVIKKIKCDTKNNRNICHIKWTGNWITGLDGILQTQLLHPRKTLDTLFVPIRIQTIEIQPDLFLEEAKKEDPYIRVDFNKNTIHASGMRISQMQTNELARSTKNQSSEVVHKQANSFLPYGCNTIQDEWINDYLLIVTNRSIQLAKEIIEQNHLGKEGHYKRILDSINRWDKYSPPSPEQIAFYLNQPDGISLRILERIYKEQRAELLKAPLMTITEDVEYGELYFSDVIGGVTDPTRISEFLSIVRENTNRNDLNILEIGTGTGGFTRLIGPYIHSDQYIATDIGKNIHLVPHKNLEHFKISYEQFNLNNSDSYEIFKKRDIDLFVASNSMHTANNLEKMLDLIYQNLKKGGFGIIYEVHSAYSLSLFGMDSGLWTFEEEREMGLWISQESWIKKLQKSGFEVISYTSDKNKLATLFLIRKPLDIELDVLQAPTIEHFEKWAPQLNKISKPTLLVAREINQSGVFGLTRTLNKERESSDLYAVKTDQELTQEQIKLIQRFGLKSNLIINQQLGTFCLTDITYQNTLSSVGLHTHIARVGDFSSFQWVNNKPVENKMYTVKYAALNFRDVMLASGKVRGDVFGYSSKNLGLGLEFSGHDEHGKRYMGICFSSIANQVDADPGLLTPIPDDWSYEEAATVPAVYLTVYYALFKRAHIQPGQSILIHAATGGVGQAAIRVCLSLNCQIFVTCHQSKRSIVKELFPQILDNRIFDSRSTTFEDQILEQTEGRGIDIVLNSLADDKLQASVRCLAKFGHFLEIGKYDLMKHSSLDMNIFLKSTTFHGIDIHELFKDLKQEKAGLMALLQDGLKQGVVKPLPRHVFDSTQIEEAFRFMAAAKHTGKVLINMQTLEPNALLQPLAKPYYEADRLKNANLALSFYEYEPETGYYLITGGLGGFGLSLMQWLFERGVRKFLVTSRRGISAGEQERVVDLLRHSGAEVIISNLNIASAKQTQELIELVKGKIRAVFHLAMTLEDGLFKNMTQEKWETAVLVKAQGAIHLDQYTRSLPLKHFIAFSSVTAAFGNIGQSNYAFGNTVMEEVCLKRKKEGLPGIAIQWGLIGQVGFIANHQGSLTSLTSIFELIPIANALDFINDVLINKTNSHTVMYNNYRLRIQQEKMETITAQQTIEQINRIIKIDLMHCNANDTLEFLGADSLQVVEIQMILVKNLQETLPLKKISSMKIEELRQLIEKKIGEKKAETWSTQNAALAEETLTLPIHQKGHISAIYVFLGYGVDGKAVKFPEADRFDIHLVCWENGASAESLAQSIEKDIQKRGYQNIQFLTHSAGYFVAKEVLSKLNLKIDRLSSISLVNEDILRPITKIPHLEQVPASEFMKAYQNLWFYVPNHLSDNKLKQQSLLLSKVINGQNIAPHLILTPRSDTVCDRSRKGLEIEGNHQVDSFNLKEIYALL